MQNLLIKNWGISSEIILQEAKKLSYKTEIISKNDNLFSIAYWSDKIYFKSVDCGINSAFWLKISDNKELTYLIAEENNIKVPKNIYIDRAQLNDTDFTNLDIVYPVISKPIDWGHWDWVAINLHNVELLKEWVKYSFKNPQVSRVVIQQQIKGDDHRIIVLNWKVIAVSKRIPPYIKWDWETSIKELINLENTNPKRGSWYNHDGIMSKILVDKESICCISEQWYTLESIPKKGITINIRKNANLSSWWLAIDMTFIIHESIKNEAIKIAKICWLSFCWVDYFCEDISEELKIGNWAIIELNATPWIRMHHFPSQWESRNVASLLLQELFK